MSFAFTEEEVEFIIREFNLRFKRGMTERDWLEYCSTLEARSTGWTYKDSIKLIAMSFIPSSGVK